MNVYGFYFYQQLSPENGNTVVIVVRLENNQFSNWDIAIGGNMGLYFGKEYKLIME